MRSVAKRLHVPLYTTTSIEKCIVGNNELNNSLLKDLMFNQLDHQKIN